MKLLIIFALILCGWIGETAYCHGKPGDRLTNEEPVWTGTPKLLRTHKYGKLYEIGENTTTMKLLHVYGNMYQMGFAHGTLLQAELQ